MQNCVNCQKKMIVKIIKTILNLRAPEIAKLCHMSISTVTKYLAGERNSIELDIYLIERIFAIKVKEYTRYDRV